MISYQEGARCIFKHCHDLHEKPVGCKRKFVRSTLLSPHTGGVTKILTQINGPLNNFKCSGELADCGCIHSEIKVIQELLRLVTQTSFQYILLCSYSPCTRCANAIMHSQVVSAVIFDKMTEHDTRGYERLKSVMPTLPVWEIEEISLGKHHGELCFVKRWGEG